MYNLQELEKMFEDFGISKDEQPREFSPYDWYPVINKFPEEQVFIKLDNITSTGGLNYAKLASDIERDQGDRQCI